MRASEFLIETKEELNVCLILMGIDLSDLASRIQLISEDYNSGALEDHEALRLLTSIMITCSKLIASNFWIRNIEDPDQRFVFDWAVSIFNQADAAIRNI